MLRSPDPLVSAPPGSDLDAIAEAIRGCRVCRDAPRGGRLPHEPRPVFRASETATICIAGQAPGTRVHASGTPFTDASGDRLRQWMGVTPGEFYDEGRIAIVPMGFCYPGQDRYGGDLPPRRECAPLWRHALFQALPRIEMVLAVGSYAMKWHLGAHARPTLGETVAAWQQIWAETSHPRVLPLPHPSWRNNAWIKRHPWFEAELLPFVQGEIRTRLAS